MAVISLCISLFFSWMFGLASFHKLGNLTHYAKLVADYGISNSYLAKLLAVFLGLIELLLVVLLLIPAIREIALVMVVALLITYAVAMTVQLILGRRQVNCGCAGPASDTQVSGVLVIRNVILAGLAVVSLAGNSDLVVSVNSLLFIVCLVAFMILLYLCAEQLISNSQRLASLGSY